MHSSTLRSVIQSCAASSLKLTFASETVDVKVSVLHLEHLTCAGSSTRVASNGWGRRRGRDRTHVSQMIKRRLAATNLYRLSGMSFKYVLQFRKYLQLCSVLYCRYNNISLSIPTCVVHCTVYRSLSGVDGEIPQRFNKSDSAEVFSYLIAPQQLQIFYEIIREFRDLGSLV